MLHSGNGFVEDLFEDFIPCQTDDVNFIIPEFRTINCKVSFGGIWKYCEGGFFQRSYPGWCWN